MLIGDLFTDESLVIRHWQKLCRPGQASEATKISERAGERKKEVKGERELGMGTRARAHQLDGRLPTCRRSATGWLAAAYAAAAADATRSSCGRGVLC